MASFWSTMWAAVSSTLTPRISSRIDDPMWSGSPLRVAANMGRTAFRNLSGSPLGKIVHSRPQLKVLGGRERPQHFWRKKHRRT